MIILDTCAFLWLVSSPDRLSIKARRALETQPMALVSISAWELAMKAGAGKLVLPPSLSATEFVQQALEVYDIHEVMLDSEMLCAAAGLPSIHRDPCDRMIIAAALTRNLPVVTADAVFLKYSGIQVIW